MMSNCRRFDTAITGADFREFSYHLLNDRNFLPDVLLDMKRMMEEYQFMMGRCCQPFALVDGQNQIGGVFFMSDIVPGHEGVFYIWIWNPRVYTATTNKFLYGYIEHYAEENQLARVVCRTPDEKLGRLLECLSFKMESRAARGFKSGGKFLNLYAYRRLFNFT